MENKQHKDFDEFFQNKLNNRKFDYQEDFWTEMEAQLPQESSAIAPKGEARKRLLLLLLMIGFLTIIGWFIYPFVANTESISEEKVELGSELTLESAQITERNINRNQKTIINQAENTIINNENKNDVESMIINNYKSEIPNLISNKDRKTDYFTNNINAKSVFKSDKRTEVFNEKEVNETLDAIKTKEEKSRLEGQPMAGNIGNESEKGAVGNHYNEIKNKSPENELLLNTVLTKTILLKKDSINQANLIKGNCDGCPVLPPAHQFKIALIAGLNTSFGFKNIGSTRANPSLDPLLGFQVTYRHSMTSQWRTNVEAIYFSRSALNAQIGYDSISYGFGSTVVSRNINIEELHYISMPIYATYQYNKKHAFMGGLSFGYLMNAQSQTSGSIMESMANNENVYTEAVTEEWGYTTAFNRFDIGATLGYDYDVQGVWKIGVRFNYGLMDVTRNNIFNNTTFDNNVSLRLVMTYDLFTL